LVIVTGTRLSAVVLADRPYLDRDVEPDYPTNLEGLRQGSG